MLERRESYGFLSLTQVLTVLAVLQDKHVSWYMYVITLNAILEQTQSLCNYI